MLQNFYKNNKCFHLDTLLLIIFLNNPVDFKTVVNETVWNKPQKIHESGQAKICSSTCNGPGQRNQELHEDCQSCV